MTRREALKASPLNYARRLDENGQTWFATEQRMYLQVDGTMKPCTWPAHTADLQTWEPVLPEVAPAAVESAAPARSEAKLAEPVPSKERYAKQPAKQAKLMKKRR